MKNIFIAITVLFFSFSANAQGKGRQKLNWDNLKTALFAVVPVYFAQVALHEGSHAITAKSFGAEITAFNIFPSKYDGKFYFGYVMVKMPRPATSREKALVAISPKIANVCLFSITEIIFRTGLMDNSPRLATILFIFGEVAPWIDFTVGIVSSLDMRDFESATGLRPSFTRTIGAAVSVAGLYLLFQRAKKIFLSPRREKKSERFGIGIVDGGALVIKGKF